MILNRLLTDFQEAGKTPAKLSIRFTASWETVEHGKEMQEEGYLFRRYPERGTGLETAVLVFGCTAGGMRNTH